MKRVVLSEHMKRTEAYTIQQMEIPSVVLMERAAMEVAGIVQASFPCGTKLLVVCGPGNNGGDGVAVGRILYLAGYQVDLFLAPCEPRKRTDLLKEQLKIAKNLGIPIRTDLKAREYTVIVDALFGIGLHRPVTDEYADVIEAVNEAQRFVVAVDVPSGINCDTGSVCGMAIKADVTVTFGMAKPGLILFPGCSYTGELLVKDIGLVTASEIDALYSGTFYYESLEDCSLPQRYDDSNKGTYGKVLLIAGIDDMTGAAMLAAKACYRIGTGLVRVLTGAEGVQCIRNQLPEVMVSTLSQGDAVETLNKHLSFANVIAIGPGLGTGETAKRLVERVCEYSREHEHCSVVFDADALNLIALQCRERDGYCGEAVSDESKVSAQIENLRYLLPSNCVLTPHPGELSRLLHVSVSWITEHFYKLTDQLCSEQKIIFVCKNARTIVCGNNRRFLNTAGNHGMSTGGSGDVLTGMIAGMIAGGMTLFDAASNGVYLHAYCGDLAAKDVSKRSLISGDIVEKIPQVMVQYDSRLKNRMSL